MKYTCSMSWTMCGALVTASARLVSGAVATIVSCGLAMAMSMIRSGANRGSMGRGDGGRAVPPSPSGPWENGSAAWGRSRGCCAPQATGMSGALSRSRIFRAFWVHSSAGKLPVEQVTATTVAPGDLTASIRAIASSIPGSQSMRRFITGASGGVALVLQARAFRVSRATGRLRQTARPAADIKLVDLGHEPAPLVRYHARARVGAAERSGDGCDRIGVSAAVRGEQNRAPGVAAGPGGGGEGGGNRLDDRLPGPDEVAYQFRRLILGRRTANELDSPPDPGADRGGVHPPALLLPAVSAPAGGVNAGSPGAPGDAAGDRSRDCARARDGHAGVVGRTTGSGDILHQLSLVEACQCGPHANRCDAHGRAVGRAGDARRLQALPGAQRRQRPHRAGPNCRGSFPADAIEPGEQLLGDQMRVEGATAALDAPGQSQGLLGVVGNPPGGVTGMVGAVGWCGI